MDDKNAKYVKDAVHGYIKISPISVKIIDTPEFQRLRNIRQMGFVYFVYPSANHTRFEHSIGVSFLAGEMARHLLKPFSDTEEVKASWIKCAEVAGLCHDLGHGPFSHDFEKGLAPGIKPEGKSIKIFDIVCQYDWIGDYIDQDERDTVKAMIHPENYQEIIAKYPDKEFMFQIVSNDENGIDVDKWDYLARDAFYLGQNSNFDYMRLFAHAKALKVDGKMHICYPLKLKENIHGIYHLKRWNFKHAYQHRVVLCIGLMFADAVKEGQLQITDKSTDAIYYKLRGKSELIEKIERRKLYVSLGGIPKHKLFQNDDTPKTANKAIDLFLDKFKDAKDIPKKEELRVGSQSFKYGRMARNRFRKIYFYPKSDPQNAQSLPEADIDAMFAAAFAEPTFFFYSTREGDFADLRKKMRCFANDLN